MAKKKKVVVIGGGTGTYQVLSGLKRYPLELSAVVSMCDSGGSTGRLRKELGILPPGDIRRAILALSDLPFAQKTLTEIFDFRFENGENLKGHSVGNILLAALTQITGSMDKAIEEAARILHASGNIYPVTLDNTNLVAQLSDGTRIFGEKNIDARKIKPTLPITKVFLTPKANVFVKAKEAIEESDLIVIGPGDLYTSIVPALLVNGVSQAITNSNARVVYVVNLMTKRGETEGYKASNFVNEIVRYLGKASSKISHVFINRKLNNNESKVAKWYKRYKSESVKNDLDLAESIKIIERDFLGKSTFFRHDSEKLAKAIVFLL